MSKSKDFIKKFAEQRDRIKKRFEVERTGEQLQYIDQSKLFKPLLETQKQIQDKIVSSRDTLSNALTPITNELRKRNEQVGDLQSFPYYNVPKEIEDVPQSTPTKAARYDLHKLLDDTDIENLEDMSLPLPSRVLLEENYEVLLDKIKELNRQHGQYLGTGKAAIKDERERKILQSRKVTLQKYKETLEDQMKNRKYKTGQGLRKRALCKPKRNRGRPRIYPDTIVYNSANDLCHKLNELVAAKGAGNTGLDNTINAVLDELLNISAIDKDTYNSLFTNIFPNI